MWLLLAHACWLINIHNFYKLSITYYVKFTMSQCVTIILVSQLDYQSRTSINLYWYIILVVFLVNPSTWLHLFFWCVLSKMVPTSAHAIFLDVAWICCCTTILVIPVGISYGECSNHTMLFLFSSTLLDENLLEFYHPLIP